MTRKSNETTSSSSGQYDSSASDSESSRWLDVSVPLRNAMVYWPSDPPVRIENVKDIEHGASSTVSMISMGSHTGTHMDAPLHFIRQGIGIGQDAFGYYSGSSTSN